MEYFQSDSYDYNNSINTTTSNTTTATTAINSEKKELLEEEERKKYFVIAAKEERDIIGEFAQPLNPYSPSVHQLEESYFFDRNYTILREGEEWKTERRYRTTGDTHFQPLELSSER